jgi:hypothetical protein
VRYPAPTIPFALAWDVFSPRSEAKQQLLSLAGDTPIAMVVWVSAVAFCLALKRIQRTRKERDSCDPIDRDFGVTHRS